MSKATVQRVPRVAIVTDLLKNNKGRFVTTVHIKQDGTVRTINGRFGVTKGVTGNGMNHDPAEKGQNVIAEITAERDRLGRFTGVGYRYRTVDFKTLQMAKFNGKILVAQESTIY